MSLMSFGEFVELVYLVLTMVCSWAERTAIGMSKNSRNRPISQQK